MIAALRVVACCSSLALAAIAQGVPGTVTTIDGRTLVGTFRADGERAVVTPAAAASSTGGETTLAVAELATFERADAAAVTVAAPHRVWLRSGAELPCTRIHGRAPAAGKKATVVVELPSGLSLEVPLSSLRALRQAGGALTEPPLFAADLRQPSDNDDQLYIVKDGKSQRSAVTITALGDSTVDFLLRGDAYDFGLDGVAAIVFGANTGLAPDRQGKPRTRLELTTGEALEGKLLACDGETMRVRLDEGAELTVPTGKLLRMQVASDRLAWLQDLRPNVEQTPAFDRVWPWTVGRSQGGPGFAIAGQQFTRGIGMVPRTRLTYDLGGRFDRFEATLGIDDRGGPDAHAILRVLVDGVVRFESQPLVRGAAGVPVRVPLGKGKTLAIEADFGKNYDLGDHCVFADARVLQQ